MYLILFINPLKKQFMKKKIYEMPSTEVVELQHQDIICTSPGGVSAAMEGQFEEEDLSREFTMDDSDDDLW